MPSPCFKRRSNRDPRFCQSHFAASILYPSVFHQNDKKNKTKSGRKKRERERERERETERETETETETEKKKPEAEREFWIGD